MSQLDALIEAVRDLKSIQLDGDAVWELTTLRAVEAWAKKQLPFKVGDRVKLRDGYTVPASAHGWLPYAKDVLFPGSTGTVCEVKFNAHYGVWQFAVEFDTHDGVFAMRARDLITGADL